MYNKALLATSTPVALDTNPTDDDSEVGEKISVLTNSDLVGKILGYLTLREARSNAILNRTFHESIKLNVTDENITVWATDLFPDACFSEDAREYLISAIRSPDSQLGRLFSTPEPLLLTTQLIDGKPLKFYVSDNLRHSSNGKFILGNLHYQAGSESLSYLTDSSFSSNGQSFYVGDDLSVSTSDTDDSDFSEYSYGPVLWNTSNQEAPILLELGHHMNAGVPSRNGEHLLLLLDEPSAMKLQIRQHNIERIFRRLLGRIGLSYCATNNPSIGPSKLLPRFLMLCAA